MVQIEVFEVLLSDSEDEDQESIRPDLPTYVLNGNQDCASADKELEDLCDNNDFDCEEGVIS